MADDLAARAASLAARLSDATQRESAPPVEQGDQELVRRWRDAVARGDDQVFRRRLVPWTTQDPSHFVAALTRTTGPDRRPDWLQILEVPMTAPVAVIESDRPLAGLTASLVARARQRVEDPEGLLSARAAADLTAHLSDRLAGLIQTSVDSMYRAAHAEGIGWHAFERDLAQTDLWPMWRDRPVLARLVGRTMIAWAESVNELLTHFAADRTLLADLLAVSQVGGIRELAPGRSDPHHGGRSVTVVTVSTERGTRRVVYKPKSLAAEVFLSEVLSWAADLGIDTGPPLRVLDRCDHGWAEFVQRVDTHDPATYFRRCGMLTAILFALGGNDCHAENLVARGDQPVVIDAETVLQPQIKAEADADPPMPDDVLDLLMLPRWLRVGGRAVDLSALGATGSGVPWERRVLRWQDPGTDDARLTAVRVATDLSSAAAMQDGELWRPQDFADEIVGGFADAWDRLAGSKDALLTGPLAGLADIPVRVLVRMTRTYARIADTSLHPDLLVDGLQRSFHLEHLARFVMDRDDWRDTLPLIDAERDQMEDGDIPLFTVAGDAGSLAGDTGQHLLAFTESAQARAHRRVWALADPLRDRQEELVRTSLALAPRRVRSDLLAGYADESDPLGAGDPQQVAAAAHQLLDQVMHQTRDLPTGLVAASPEQWGIEHHTVGWYDGTTGIIVGLAAASRALGDADAGERARDLLTRDLAEARGRGSRLWRGRGVGGQDGVGGLLLGWSLAAGLLPDRGPEVADTALDLLAGGQARTEGADLLTGSLGLLAGLMALAQVGIEVPSPVVEQTVAVTLQATGTYLSGDQVNGFSHGNSGIAAVLAQCARLGWGDTDEVAQHVDRALAAESARFDPVLRDWRDLRVPGRTGPGPGWCNGSPGMAAARVLAGDPGGDLERLVPLLSADVQPRDNLCCGTSGRVEVLRLLRDAGVATAAERHSAATAGLADRVCSGRLRLGVPPASRLQPLGLFQGISGPLVALCGALDPTLPHGLAWGSRVP